MLVILSAAGAAFVLGLMVLCAMYCLAPSRKRHDGICSRLDALEASTAPPQATARVIQNIENYYEAPSHAAPKAPLNAGTAVVPRQLEVTETGEDSPSGGLG